MGDFEFPPKCLENIRMEYVTRKGDRRSSQGDKAMTVQELIDQLKDYNPDMEISGASSPLVIHGVCVRVVGGGDDSKLEILVPENIHFRTKEI